MCNSQLHDITSMTSLSEHTGSSSPDLNRCCWWHHLEKRQFQPLSLSQVSRRLRRSEVRTCRPAGRRRHQSQAADCGHGASDVRHRLRSRHAPVCVAAVSDRLVEMYLSFIFKSSTLVLSCSWTAGKYVGSREKNQSGVDNLDLFFSFLAQLLVEARLPPAETCSSLCTTEASSIRLFLRERYFFCFNMFFFS